MFSSRTIARGLALVYTFQNALAAVLPNSCPQPTTVASFPEPSADPFYNVPKNIASYQNGDVIRTRGIASTQEFGSTFSARQIFYKTTNRQGQATGTVTTAFVPTVPAPGTPKIFSYQNPEDAVGLRCNPSWSIVNGSSELEGYFSPFITAFGAFSLAQGWYFVTSDDEDRDSEWIVGNTEGRAAIDGVRAATSSLCLDNPDTVMVGYSGGAHETVWALNQVANGYALDVNVVGAAFGGTPVDLHSNYELLNGSPQAVLAIGAVVGLSHSYPELAQVLNSRATPLGKSYLAALNGPDACLVVHGTPFEGVNFSSPAVFKGGNIENDPTVKKITSLESLLMNVSPLKVPVPKMPRYQWHGLADVTVPYAPEMQYVQQQCAKGADIRFTSFPGLDHTTAAVAGIPEALIFVEQAFSGTLLPTGSNCGANFSVPALTSTVVEDLLGPNIVKLLQSLL